MMEIIGKWCPPRSFWKQALDLGGVRPGPAQKGRRLKVRPPVHGEVLVSSTMLSQRGLCLGPRRSVGSAILEQPRSPALEAEEA